MNSKNISRMLISKDKDLYKEIDASKTSTGSFFTKRDVWLTEPVAEFLSGALAAGNNVLDPYAGEGHLLDVCLEKFNSAIYGYDIRETIWEKNDSLISIPNPNNAVIVTNPPYLAKYSAKRKGVFDTVEKYFEEGREDLYQTALDRCLEAATFVVAIIPETFLNSTFSKDYLSLLCVLEENPFEDTETPVCVACFDRRNKQDAKLFINHSYCGNFSDIFSYRKTSLRKDGVRFNISNGRVALKAVDGTMGDDLIRFENANTFSYSRTNIKHSSRLLTYLEVDVLTDSEINDFVDACNSHLGFIRNKTFDLVLSPFKGNNKSGKRRRRLDYTLARTIIELSLTSMSPKNIKQDRLL
ncbi:hypothetical protein [Polynucleobacter sp. MWH-UH2A]|uniref:hypothetical protein n=1 Tax=Polynucleobacter sp. MWH-UH2A TaxID=1855617 RepID=UPI001BFEDC99|nr:hypothetical protein [Polynucleobacter sp. MWH-UH2A]QWD63369.1 hypothetical protein IC571_06620 [Polynucleobacter sp. MWH-UH2A]